MTSNGASRRSTARPIRPAAITPDVHALQVVGTLHAIGDVPTAFGGPPVRRDEVAHQCQDLHHRVLGDADAVAVGHLGDRDAALFRRLEIHMVRADARGHRQLEFGRLRDALLGQVRRPKRLGNHDIGVDQLALELRVRPLLVRRHHQLVAGVFEELAQPQRTRDTPE